MVRKAQAVVIGSGAFGSSTAYHLAAMGQQGIILLDAHEIASQTSPRAAGITKQVRNHPDMTRLAKLSVEKIVRFSDETNEPLTYHRSGTVDIARTEGDAAAIRSEIEAGQALGIDIRPLAAEDLSRLMPYSNAVGVRAISYTPSDLYIEEPGELPLGYAHAAAQLGVTVVPNNPVIAIGVNDGQVRSVMTRQGEIHTPIVVDAAGAWARLVGEQAGIEVALVPVRHQIMITEPIAGIGVHHPTCRVFDAHVYHRPHKGGLLLGGYEKHPQSYESKVRSPKFEIRDLAFDVAVFEDFIKLIGDQFPVIREAPVKEIRAGLPTMTPDSLPIIGLVPGVTGFFVASGCCAGGLSLSPGVGQVVAELMLRGHSSIPLDAFSISRFSSKFESSEGLRDACLRTYRDWDVVRLRHDEPGIQDIS